MQHGSVSNSAATVLPMPAMRFAQAAAVLSERIKRDPALAYIGIVSSAFGGDALTIGYACDDEDAEIVEVWLHGVELYDHLAQPLIDALYGPLLRAIADSNDDHLIEQAEAA